MIHEIRRIILLLIVVTIAIYAGGNKEKFCHSYAAKATGQYRLAIQRHLPDIMPPTWSGDKNGHYIWCMITPENVVNNEYAKRQAYLDRHLSGDAKNDMKHRGDLDNRQSDPGMGTGSGDGGVNGIGGMENKPGNDWGGETGAGNKAPPFDEGNGIGDMYGNKAGHRPDDKIVTPEQMTGEVDAISPKSNLYGPGIPQPDRGGVGKGGYGKNWVKKSLVEMTLVFQGDLVKLIDKLKKRGLSTDIDGMLEKNTNLYVIQVKLKKKLTLVFDCSSGTAKLDDHKTENGKSLDSSGDRGGKDPLSTKEKKMINDAKAAAAFDEILNYTPIQNDGGVVDPMGKQAQGAGGSGEKNSGHSTGHGKAPQVAHRPGSHRPGSDLTGPGRIDRPGVGKTLKLPQGVHVIDPAARRGAAYDREGSAYREPNTKEGSHSIK